jgi:hypothetical protein
VADNHERTFADQFALVAREHAPAYFLGATRLLCCTSVAKCLTMLIGAYLFPHSPEQALQAALWAHRVPVKFGFIPWVRAACHLWRRTTAQPRPHTLVRWVRVPAVPHVCQSHTPPPHVVVCAHAPLPPPSPTPCLPGHGTWMDRACSVESRVAVSQVLVRQLGRGSDVAANCYVHQSCCAPHGKEKVFGTSCWPPCPPTQQRLARCTSLFGAARTCVHVINKPSGPLDVMTRVHVAGKDWNKVDVCELKAVRSNRTTYSRSGTA